jgi:hypothetical protein
MNTVEEIKAAVLHLSRPQLEELRDWLDDYLESQLEITDGIQAKLNQSRQEIETGQFKTRC